MIAKNHAKMETIMIGLQQVSHYLRPFSLYWKLGTVQHEYLKYSSLLRPLRDLPEFILALFNTPSRKSELFTIAATLKVKQGYVQNKLKETMKPKRTNRAKRF